MGRGLRLQTIDPEPLRQDDQVPGESSESSRRKPAKVKPKPYVVQEQSVADGLKEIRSDKLQSLYYSICTINVEHHTPLIAVGVWSFFESLTASMGKSETTSFASFLDRGKLSLMGVGKGKQLNAYALAIDRAASLGNVTKHHSVAASFDTRQIVNDMKTLTPVLLSCIKELKSNA